MKNKEIYNIFKKGSKTYFYSSLFFPKSIREDIFILYSFVRKADDFVDIIPQQKKEFQLFKENYYKALKGEKTNDIIVSLFVDLIKRRKFSKLWVKYFFSAMELDLNKKNYKNLKEIEKYMVGSAEVIGLMMSNIMNLSRRSYYYACYLGKAMQYINFIRDIDEDLQLGRTYFPVKELKKYKLNSLSKHHTKKHPEHYKKFIKAQLDFYKKSQKIAEKGFKFIPRRYLIPIKTASDMYNWTAAQIEKDPFIVYKQKVKPSKVRILLTIIKNSLNL